MFTMGMQVVSLRFQLNSFTHEVNKAYATFKGNCENIIIVFSDYIALTSLQIEVSVCARL
jgi:hypothetical protein